MKILIPFFSIFLFSSCLFSQVKSFHVGIDFIPNYSFYLGENNWSFSVMKYNKKPSLKFGVVVSYQLDETLSFESGVKYVNRGHELEESWGTSRPPHLFVTGNFNYLSVPLNVRLSLSNSCNKGLYLRFGVSADYFLSTKIKYTTIGSDGVKTKMELKENNNIRKTHLNLNYGLGYSFLFGNIYQISVEPAFDYMFYRLYHKGGDFTYNSAGIKLRLMIL